MNMNRTIGGLLGTLLLLLGTGNAAWAVDYSGTLGFSAHTVPVSIQTPLGTLNGNAGLDLDRYDLGNALSGSATDITFTTSNFNSQYTLLAVLFATDPNQSILDDPTSLAGFISSGINVNNFLSTHVTGYRYSVYGFPPNGTTSISALFPPADPMTFIAGTTYYAFVAGGSLINVGPGLLVDSSVGYTLTVNAVPVPVP